MKIAHVTATFPPYYSGTGMVCHYSALYLGRMGHDVTIFTANHPPGEYDYPDEYSVERLPVLFRFGNAPFTPGLLKIKDFDIIHLHHPFIFGTEFIGAVSRLRNIPLVITHHNDLIGDGLRPYIFDGYTAVSKRFLFSQASKLLVVSKDHARSSLLNEQFNRRWDDVVEMPNGVDIEQFNPNVNGEPVRRSCGIQQSDKVLLFVGALDRAHHFRRVDQLIEALDDLRRSDVHLILAGDGDKLDDYRLQSKERDLEERVHFLGRLTHQELPVVYAAADIVVLPSYLQESFGMILIEGMACGTPVIASDLPGVRTVVDEGVDGFLVQPGDVEDLVRKTRLILQLPQQARREMGLAGRRKVEAQYSWKRIAHLLETTYFDVLNEYPLGELSTLNETSRKSISL